MKFLIVACSLTLSPGAFATTCPNFAGLYRCEDPATGKVEPTRVTQTAGVLKIGGKNNPLELKLDGTPTGIEGYMYKAVISAKCIDGGVRVDTLDNNGKRNGSMYVLRTSYGFTIGSEEQNTRDCKRMDDND